MFPSRKAAATPEKPLQAPVNSSQPAAAVGSQQGDAPGVPALTPAADAPAQQHQSDALSPSAQVQSLKFIITAVITTTLQPTRCHPF